MKVVGRVVAGIVGVLALLAGLEYLGSLLGDSSAPVPWVLKSVREPWVDDPVEAVSDLAAAADQVAPGELLAAATLTVSTDQPRGEAKLTIWIEGPVSDPLLRAVRAGKARGHGRELASVVGLSPSIRWGLNYGDPTMSVVGDRVYVSIEAAALAAPVDTTVVAIEDSYPLCGKLTRTFTVVGSGLQVVAVKAEQTSEGCRQVGAWEDQSATRAVFRGGGTARAELASTAAPPPDGISRDQSLIGNDRDVDRLLTSGGFAVLTTVPLLIVWWRMRPSAGKTPYLSLRQWAVTDLFGKHAAMAIGLMLLLHVLLNVVSLLSDLLSTVNNRLFWSRGRNPLLGLQPASELGVILLIVAVGFVWRRAGLRRAFGGKSAKGWGWLVAGLSAVFATTIPVWAGTLSDDGGWWPDHWAQPTWKEWTGGFAGHVIGLCGAVLAAMLGTLILGWALRLRKSSIATMVGGLGLVAVLLLLAPATRQRGLIGGVVGALVPVGASALAWLTLDRLVRLVVNADPPAMWDKLRTALRPWQGLRYVAAVLLSLPLVVYGSEFQPPITWYDFRPFTFSIDQTLRLVVLVLLVLLLRRLGRDVAGTTRGSLALLRTAAILVALVGLLTPAATVGGLPLAFLVGWLLFDVWLLPRRAATAERPAIGDVALAATSDAVGTVVTEIAFARVDATTEAALRKSLADKPMEDIGQPDVEGRLRVTKLTRLATRIPRPTRRQLRDALSSYTGVSPWRRACQFAVLGLVTGLPWTVLDIAAVLNVLTAGGPFRLVDAAAGLLVILRFAIAGLVMGIAYPLIRGNTGVGKGLSMFVTLSAPALCLTLLPELHLRAALLQLTQWLLFGLILGLTADYLALRRHAYGLRQLRELHHLTAATASASTLLIALLTATATTLGAGAANVFVDQVLTPPPAPSPQNNRGN
ncbi:hypothetical protein ACFVWG_20770 [Kribbella sp. NPDC058245]|uniref:hypothetical protein n=1 Tax=Kribbella sp. NPDC058245 TaxID=3346399 RepID=UPI0036E57826